MTNMIIPGSVTRDIVTDPRDWLNASATDFKVAWGGAAAAIVGGATGDELTDWGWAQTGVAIAPAFGGDFLSPTDPGTPNRLQLLTASDTILSPAKFGDHWGAAVAAEILGYQPTMLIVDQVAQFATASNAEPATSFGLFEDGATDAITTATQVAVIASDGTNFVLRNAAGSDVGAAVDTSFHDWRIQITASGMEWFIDGTSQGSIALVTDEWPARWGAGIEAAGSNGLHVGSLHIRYA